MSKPCLCPVCAGTGVVSDPPNPNVTSNFPQSRSCHGCFGRGWVEVSSEREQPMPVTPVCDWPPNISQMTHIPIQGMCRTTFYALLFFACFIASTAQAELYNWSQPSPHHAAVVQVESAGRGGSGAYVEYEGLRFILTAAHVVGGQTATVTFQNGHTATGKTLKDRYYVAEANSAQHDVGAVLIDPVDSVQPVQIASGGEMSTVEICGFGGPPKIFRNYLCRITDVGEKIFTSDGKVINGDSGGPWFSDGKIVGVSAQGTGGIISENGPYKLFQMSVSTSTQTVQDFVKRVHANHSKLVDS